MTTTKTRSLSPLQAAVIRDLEPLAKDARCINDDDWGSPRQIKAETRFFRAIKKSIHPKDFEELEGYCLKATTDEMIDEAMRLVKIPR